MWSAEQTQVGYNSKLVQTKVKYDNDKYVCCFATPALFNIFPMTWLVIISHSHTDVAV